MRCLDLHGQPFCIPILIWFWPETLKYQLSLEIISPAVPARSAFFLFIYIVVAFFSCFGNHTCFCMSCVVGWRRKSWPESWCLGSSGDDEPLFGGFSPLACSEYRDDYPVLTWNWGTKLLSSLVLALQPFLPPGPSPIRRPPLGLTQAGSSTNLRKMILHVPWWLKRHNTACVACSRLWNIPYWRSPTRTSHLFQSSLL